MPLVLASSQIKSIQSQEFWLATQTLSSQAKGGYINAIIALPLRTTNAHYFQSEN
jgi:hypothetical protein